MLTLDYRPMRLSDLVGQYGAADPLQRLLAAYKAASAEDKKGVLPAGFLFRGPRGTGKTSTARIVAMALNCESNDPEPCLKCSSCLSILSGTKAAVLEMDAASNGLVEDIRKLRESILYSHDGLYKVVILDEAHSISKEGFNALLNQLEEPPPYVLYILVTTAPEKILTTVVSRLMHFDFKAIAPGDIVSRLKMVCEKESIPYDLVALEKISLYVNGAMRDALMMLDRLRLSGTVSVEGFDKAAGTISDEAIYNLIYAELNKDMVKAVEVQETSLAGVSSHDLLEAITVFALRTMRVFEGGLDHSPWPQRLKDKVNKDVIRSLLRICWDMRQMRSGKEDDRVTLQVCLALMCEKGSIQTIAKGVDFSKKLSASEINEMFS